MFTLHDRYEFDWPVKVHYPAAEGDQVKTFTARFVMPDDELEIYDRVAADTAQEMVVGVRERLARYFIGWAGIILPDGTELPVNDANKARLLAQRPIRMAVDQALYDAIQGEREKN